MRAILVGLITMIFHHEVIAQINDSTLMVGIVIESTNLYNVPDFAKAKSQVDIMDGVCVYVVGYTKDPVGDPFKGWYYVVISEKEGFIASERLLVPIKYKQYLGSKGSKGQEIRTDFAKNVHRLSSVSKRNNLKIALDELLLELEKSKVILGNKVDMDNLNYNPTKAIIPTSQSSCNEGDIRRISKNQYPNDKDMEDFVFKNQLSACKYMTSTNDYEIKSIAVQQYPNDYEMQKYTYDNQYAAKKYMETVRNANAKSKAVQEYPKDYVMQKYIYDKIAF